MQIDCCRTPPLYLQVKHVVAEDRTCKSTAPKDWQQRTVMTRLEYFPPIPVAGTTLKFVNGKFSLRNPAINATWTSSHSPVMI